MGDLLRMNQLPSILPKTRGKVQEGPSAFIVGVVMAAVAEKEAVQAASGQSLPCLVTCGPGPRSTREVLCGWRRGASGFCEGVPLHRLKGLVREACLAEHSVLSALWVTA